MNTIFLTTPHNDELQKEQDAVIRYIHAKNDSKLHVGYQFRSSMLRVNNTNPDD